MYGKDVKSFRKQEGLTQEELAKKAGVVRAVIAELERETYSVEPTFLKLLKLGMNLPKGIMTTEGVKQIRSRYKCTDQEFAEKADVSWHVIKRLLSGWQPREHVLLKLLRMGLRITDKDGKQWILSSLMPEGTYFFICMGKGVDNG